MRNVSCFVESLLARIHDVISSGRLDVIRETFLTATHHKFASIAAQKLSIERSLASGLVCVSLRLPKKAAQVYDSQAMWPAISRLNNLDALSSGAQICVYFNHDSQSEGYLLRMKLDQLRSLQILGF